MRTFFSSALALALTGTLAAPAPSSGHAGSAGAPGGPACEVRVLSWPEGADDGTVMDIEVVPGMGTVYYGSYVVQDGPGGSARRAVVWYGLDAEPVVVGPAGTYRDVAFELTPSGKVNGASVVDESGREQAWVQDLRNGKLTFVDTGDAEGHTVRRINDRGEAAGTLYSGDTAQPTVWWPRPSRPGRALEAGELAWGEALAINNVREVAGFFDHYLPAFDAVVPWAVVWDRHGSSTPLASNPGVEGDSWARVINDAGQAAGSAWYGSWDGGHYEAARWPSPDAIEPLGLLPGGGYSEVFGQSEGGWTVGWADHVDHDNPGAMPWGGVEHSVLWTEDADVVRVLPSPWAVANGEEDWRNWYGGPAHGVHTGLDQVGTRAHDAWHADGSIRFAPTVYVNASRCGESVHTTHAAPWEEQTEASLPASGDAFPATARPSARTVTSAVPQPAAYRHDAVRERALGRQ